MKVISNAKQMGRKIRDRREQMNMSQQKLADLSDSSKGYISNLETGSIDGPSVYKVLKLANALETTLDYLIYDYIHIADAVDKKFYSHYLTLEPITKRKIRNTVKLWW